jgi:hypothetical protein
VALASGSAKRPRIAPNIPTIGEVLLPGFECTVWFGLILPSPLIPRSGRRTWSNGHMGSRRQSRWTEGVESASGMAFAMARASPSLRPVLGSLSGILL